MKPPIKKTACNILILLLVNIFIVSACSLEDLELKDTEETAEKNQPKQQAFDIPDHRPVNQHDLVFGERESMLCNNTVDNINYCGSRNPLGCSCLPECEYLGNCCPDYQASCSAFPGLSGVSNNEVEFLAGEGARRGRKMWKSFTNTASARIAQDQTENVTTGAFIGVAKKVGDSDLSVAGLTTIAVAETDNLDERSECLIEKRSASQQAESAEYYALKSSVFTNGSGNDDASVLCRGTVLNLGEKASNNELAYAFYSDETEVSASTDESENSKSIIGNGMTGPNGSGRSHEEAYAAGDAYPVLTSYTVENANKNHGVCEAKYTNGNFILEADVVANPAFTGQNAFLKCESKIIDGNGNGLTLIKQEDGNVKIFRAKNNSNPYRVTENLNEETNTTGTYSEGEKYYFKPEFGTQMTDVGSSTCFLTKVAFNDISDNKIIDFQGIEGPANPNGCKISSHHNKWFLTSLPSLGVNSYYDYNCEAICFSHDTAAEKLWPPPVDRRISVSGAEAYLFSYGESASNSNDTKYDSPFIFIEGGDATNSTFPESYLKWTAEVMSHFLALGFDAWFIDFSDSGQASQVYNAQKTAELIAEIDYLSRVASHSAASGDQFPYPLKIPITGGSEGGSRPLLALSMWQQGIFSDGEETELYTRDFETIRDTVRDNTPPVSAVIGINPTVLGTHLPASLLAFGRDFATGIEDFASSDIAGQFNAINTQEVLEEYIEDSGEFSICWEKAGGNTIPVTDTGIPIRGMLYDRCAMDVEEGPFLLLSLADLFSPIPQLIPGQHVIAGIAAGNMLLNTQQNTPINTLETYNVNYTGDPTVPDNNYAIVKGDLCDIADPSGNSDATSHRAIHPAYLGRMDSNYENKGKYVRYGLPNSQGIVNGFPQGDIFKVAISSGSWFAQQCDRLPDYLLDSFNWDHACKDAGNTDDKENYYGDIEFWVAPDVRDPLSPINSADCYRYANYRLHYDRERDAWPGDIAPMDLRQFNTEMRFGLNGFQKKMYFDQYTPFYYNRTDSSLGCPFSRKNSTNESDINHLPRWPHGPNMRSSDMLELSVLSQALPPAVDENEETYPPMALYNGDRELTTDQACQEFNEEQSTWNRVHSQHMKNKRGKVYNAEHTLLDIENRILTSLYAWDCRVADPSIGLGFGDCDGYFSDGGGEDPINPFYQEALNYINVAALHPNSDRTASDEFKAIIDEFVDCDDRVRNLYNDCGIPDPRPYVKFREAESITQFENEIEYTISLDLSFPIAKSLDIHLLMENLGEETNRGSATYGVDLNLPTVVTVPAYETSVDLTFSVIPDQYYESSWEYFDVGISAGKTYIVVNTNSSHQIKIRDDDDDRAPEAPYHILAQSTDELSIVQLSWDRNLPDIATDYDEIEISTSMEFEAENRLTTINYVGNSGTNQEIDLSEYNGCRWLYFRARTIAKNDMNSEWSNVHNPDDYGVLFVDEPNCDQTGGNTQTPENFNAALDNEIVTLTWDALDKLPSVYNLYASFEKGDTGSKIQEVPGDEISFSLDLDQDDYKCKTVYFSLSATSTDNYESDIIGLHERKIPPVHPTEGVFGGNQCIPPAPTVLGWDFDDLDFESLILWWKGISPGLGVNHYNIYASVDTADNPQFVASSIGRTWDENFNQPICETHFWQIKAVKNDIESEPAPLLFVRRYDNDLNYYRCRPVSPPIDVQIIPDIASPSSLTIHWNYLLAGDRGGQGEHKYYLTHIYRSINGGEFTLLETIDNSQAYSGGGGGIDFVTQYSTTASDCELNTFKLKTENPNFGESIEYSNSVKYMYDPTGNCPIPLPDLTIKSVTYEPNPATTAEAVTFKVVVKNQGNIVSAATDLIFKTSNENAIEETYALPVLQPNEVITLTHVQLFAVPKGYTNTLIIDANNGVEELDEENNQKILLLKVEKPKADLVFESLNHSPLFANTGEPVSFSVMVKNQGLNSSKESHLSFRINDNVDAGEDFVIPVLQPDESHIVTREYTFSSANNYTNTLILDVNDDVIESDETNNQATYSYTIRKGPIINLQPDLTFDAFSHSPSPARVSQPVTFSVVIKNQGDSSSSSVSVAFRIDNEAGNGEVITVPKLQPGEMYTLERVHTFLIAKDYANTLSIDFNDELIESDETNNQQTYNYTIENQIAPLLPNLVFDTLSHKPDPAQVSSPVTFTVLVKNAGTSDSTETSLTFQIGNEAGGGNVYPIPALKPDQSTTITRTHTFSLSQSYMNTLIIDPRNQITESDETDNQTQYSYTIGK